MRVNFQEIVGMVKIIPIFRQYIMSNFIEKTP